MDGINPNNMSGEGFNQPASAPQAPLGGEKKPVKKSLVAGLIIAAVLIAGGAFAYTYFFPSDNAILWRSFDNLEDAKTAEYSGSFKALASGALPIQGLPVDPALVAQVFDLTADFSGSIDESDLKNIKYSLSVKTNFINAILFSLGFIKGGSIPPALEVEDIVIGEASYVKFKNLPSGLPGVDLKSLENSWIKFDRESILDFVKGLGLNTDQLESQMLDSEKINEELIEALKDILNDFEIVRVKERLAPEEINGMETHHFKLEVDKKELSGLIFEIFKLASGSETETFSGELEDLERFMNFFTFKNTEIWIGKNDLLPYKISLEVEIKDAGGLPGFSPTIEFNISFKNYNKPVNIIAPSPVIQFKDAIAPLLKGLPGGLPFPGSGAGIPPTGLVDTDKDGLPDEEEILLWKTDPKNPDTDGDGFKDGEEVKNGFNPKGAGKLSL